MKLGDIEYTKLVDKLMGHKHTSLSPAECAAEIKDIADGAVSTFAESDVQDRTVNEVQPIPQQPKRRGRPPGSHNKPKEK